jgi:hypothetical protein
VNAADDPSQSLDFCVEAVLAAFGHSVAREELSAVMGNAFLLSYSVDAPPGQQWNAYGRHTFLETTARLYGLELRDLHPPDAAPLPLTPPEFEGHFVDSYLPLVQTALAHGYPAFAWMGWPQPNGTLWGVVTGFDAANGRCLGQTIYSRGRPVAFTSAPVQVYTVQEFREVRASPAELLKVMLNHAAVIMKNLIPSNYRVTSGPASLEAWRGNVATIGPDMNRRLSQSFVAGRQAALDVFSSFRQAADADQIRTIDEYALLFEQQIKALSSVAGEEQLSMALDDVTKLERRAAAIGAIPR